MSAEHPSLESEQTLAPDREMLIEVCGLVARVERRMPWIEAVLVLSLGLFMFRFVPPWLFIGWGCLTVGMEAVRAHHAADVLRRGQTIDPRRTHTIFVLQAGFAGAAVGLGGIIFLPRLPLVEQSLFGIVLMIMPAAGVAVSQSSRAMAIAYSMGILIPTCVTWLRLHPGLDVPVVAMCTLYFFLIILIATEGSKLLLRSVMIRHERDRLVRDLEQRNIDVRAAMTEAEQSAMARARVLAAASHDLRQPLHALSVYSAVLAANPPPEAMREVGSNIDQIVRSLGNLLHGLLDLSRLSSGHYTIDRQPVSLHQLLSSVCLEYERAAHEKGLELIQDLRPAAVMGDSVALGRVARNLIDNAIKYTDSGSITVTAAIDSATQPPSAVFSITDTGKGIPASEQSRIFEEFYQLDNPGRDRSKGVGLGLAIVQRLCELSHAQISVHSEVGAGTRFSVRLADVIASSQPQIEPERVEPTPVPALALGGRRVYVVDDEVDILKSMTRLLELWGGQARSAHSPTAAVLLFEEHGKPDLLITDLRLGAQENGAELTLRLRQRFGDFPALVTTGEISHEALGFASDHALRLLHKPITEEALRGAMSELLAGAPKPVTVAMAPSTAPA